MLASYQLSAPNTVATPALFEDFVHRLALRTGLTEEEANHLSEPLRLAAEYLIEYSYPENRVDELHVFCDIFPQQVSVRLNDHGLPRHPFDGAPLDAAAAPLVERMRQALDRLGSWSWSLKGFEGKQLQMLYPLPREPLCDVLARGAQMRRPTRAQPVEEELYVIRPFQEGDEAAISELVYRSYGVSYDDEDYYYPQKILAENRSAAMISIVAQHPQGEIVGHYALEMRDMEGVYEGTSAVVNAAHRGRHLMERLRQRATDEGRRMGLRGLIFLPWTVHTYSQKANEHFGAHLVGVNLSDSAPVAILGHETESLLQRVSTLLYYTQLRPRPPRALYVPSRLEGRVIEMLRPLQCDPQLASATPEAANGQTILRTRNWPRDRFVELTVDRIGSDAEAELRGTINHLLAHERAETIYLNLPMNSPACPQLADFAESMGFFFIGVGPDFCRDGDSLRLAMLVEPLDPSHIHVLTSQAKDLLTLVLAESKRVLCTYPSAFSTPSAALMAEENAASMQASP